MHICVNSSIWMSCIFEFLSTNICTQKYTSHGAKADHDLIFIAKETSGRLISGPKNAKSTEDG